MEFTIGKPLNVGSNNLPDELWMQIQIYFDKHFLRLHKNSLRQSEIVLKNIFERLQSIFHLQSLETRIHLELAGDPVYVRDQV